jgi:hypothetical protein
VTDKTDEPVGIAGLKPTAHAEWKAREAFRKELCACLSRELPKDPLQQHIEALRMAAEVVGRLGDTPHNTLTIRHPVANALDDLVEALEHLRFGIVEPFLRPPEGVGTKLKKPSERRRARDAVTAVKCLTGMGIPVAEARKRVARVLGIKASLIRTWQTPGRGPGLRK